MVDRSGFALPMGWTDISEAAGLGLDHVGKRIMAESPLLLEVNVDVSKQFVCDSFGRSL
ncbi:hypothetical protein M3S04_12835 [Xanthomonas sp. PPL139]|uniref:hypothetical protein n=1 Tax=unclassified Xanthomonas TaxID=2643310 RepID=UPI0033A6FD94